MFKKITVLLFAVILAFAANAQIIFIHTDVFHRVPPPTELLSKIQKTSITQKALANPQFPDIATFRIIGPVAGYGITKNSLVTGVGYGYNILHYVDTLQTYHAKVSFNAMLYGSASLGVPSLNPNNKNILGIGPAVGLFNNVLLIGYCWKAPLIAGTSGQSDLVIAGHFTIN